MGPGYCMKKKTPKAVDEIDLVIGATFINTLLIKMILPGLVGKT